jgi:hypothetical protein
MAEQQSGSPHDMGNDVSGYDYEASGSRPSSRGSKHSVESNGSSYGSAGSYTQQQYYHNNPQAQQHLQSQQHQRQGGTQLDEDDDEMW